MFDENHNPRTSQIYPVAPHVLANIEKNRMKRKGEKLGHFAKNNFFGEKENKPVMIRSNMVEGNPQNVELRVVGNNIR